jgi:hypothetical protein
MEKEKKRSRKGSQPEGGADIKKAYIEYLLEEGKQPESVFKFCRQLGISESDFYELAGSFEALEGVIWNDWLGSTIGRLKENEEYATFGTREKLLTFYYALFEELRQNRSMVLKTARPRWNPEITPAFLKFFRKTFMTYINDLLSSGRQSGEIANRPYLEKTYPALFWLHFCFLLSFWMNDSSPGFEKTDAAIEKSVNLAFDLIGKGAVDSALDFARFLYQSAN